MVGQLRPWLGVAGLALALVGTSQMSCGTQGTMTGEACAGRDLSNVCPAGTRPRLDAGAEAQCSGEAGVQVITQQGEVSGACASIGRCTVFCETDPSFSCEHGIQSISRESVICASATMARGCGNGACDEGENTVTCPIDCSGICSAGQQRCNGASREMCNLAGRWDTVSCVEGERCVENDNNTTTCVRSEFVANLYTMPGGQGLQQNPNGTQQTIPQQSQPQQGTHQSTLPPQQQNAQGNPQAQTFACDATFPCVRVATGFLPDPVTVAGRSGGSNQYTECSGFFAESNSPDHILYLDTDFAYLRLTLQGSMPGTTMLLAALDGSNAVYCSQPPQGAPILGRRFASGTYGVWIGSAAANRYEDYNFVVTEYRP